MTPKHSLVLLFLLILPNTVCAATKYVVKQGDSLYNLAKKFGVPVNGIKKTNELRSDRLDVGDILWIPDTARASVTGEHYVVVKDDTLGGIGIKLGVSVRDIKKANNLKSDYLRIGQKLVIPSPSASSNIHVQRKKEAISPKQKEPNQIEASSPSAPTRHTIKKGDTLGAIAYKFGVSVNQLKSENGLTSDHLRIGKVLVIPTSGAGTSRLQRVVTDGEYIVKKGDSLYGLSKRYGVSVHSLKEKNGLKSNKLNIGDLLVIPGSSGGLVEAAESKNGSKEDISADRVEYSVVKGDTLGGISRKVSTSVADLRKLNNITGDRLRIGQKLLVPSSSRSNLITSVVEKAEVPSSRSGGKTAKEIASISTPVSIKYTVRKGDSLSEIAKSFGVSVRELKNVNGLSSNQLIAGKVLTIPRSVNRGISPKINTETVITDKRYVIKKGDSLSIIAKKFGVSIESIKRANALSRNNIYSGRVLLIPNSGKDDLSSYQPQYVVAKGDTLSGIGYKFGVAVGDLKSANRIKGNTISVGQVLSIPVKKQYETTPVKAFSDTYDKKHTYNGNKNGLYSSRKSIITVAKKFLGAPYKFGGNSPVKGLDCSAFVNKVFDFFEVDLPRTARDIYKVGQNVGKDELITGDLVFFRTYASYPSHVGIYIGDTDFIHASSKAKKVTINSMNQPYYRKRYIGAKRIEVGGIFYSEMSKEYKGFESQ